MSLLDTLASYVPNFIVHRLNQNPKSAHQPFAEQFPATVLFADISGFTPLTEQLALSGPQGAEKLAGLLNDYFGRLIEIVYANGGDVVKFAGDALLALWPAESSEGGHNPYIREAAQCGLHAQHSLRNFEAGGNIQLSLRIGISYGEVICANLGGEFRRWEFLLTGDAVVQASEAEKHARPGQVAIASKAWEMISENFVGYPIFDGYHRIQAAIESVHEIPAQTPAAIPEIEAGLRAYIPGAILSRLSAGQTHWLAELRRVTIIFVNLPDLGQNTPLEEAQEIMRSLQNAIYRFEGSINKLNVDDKGVTLIAVMGLPPYFHENDPLRGIQTAREIQSRLQALGLRNAIGVTTGEVFCGTVGSPLRREYTIMGDVVNLAARLMVAAPGDILCDEPTYQAARADLVFETLPAVNVKGKSEPIPVFRPQKKQRRLPLVRPETELVGRTSERSILAGQLQAFLRGLPSSVVLIEGEAGIGKSRLVTDLLDQANRLGIKTLIGYGDSIEKLNPYHAWRAVFRKLFFLDDATDSQIRNAPISMELFNDPELAYLIPLLNVVLPLELPHNDITNQMTPEVRAENTRKLMLQILQTNAERTPSLLVIEDAHWLDSASWALTLAVLRQVRPLLAVIVTRPFPGPVPPEYRQIFSLPDTISIELSSLEPEEILALVSQSLGVRALPERVAALIQEKAQGNPFFSEQLAYTLRDSGVIQIRDGVCVISPDSPDLDSLDLPDTVQGAIISRVDRLAAQVQLTLKVASVIGRFFPYKTLFNIYPIKEDKPELEKYLDTLEEQNITLKDAPEPELAYIFKHIITQEVVYNLLLFAQRKQLHRAVAVWYETNFSEDLTLCYPLLAHHWNKAEDPQKAIDYLSRAGELAISQYANREAIDYFSLGLELYTRHQGEVRPVPKLQLARWERQLGVANLRLGRLARSEEHLRRALELLERPFPQSGSQFTLGLIGQIVRQLFGGLRKPSRSLDAGQKETLFETARVFRELGEIYFFAQNTSALIYTNLSTINFTQAAGPTPELANAYASMGVAAGLIPLHKLARDYLKRGKEVAAAIEHLPSNAFSTMVDAVYYIGLGKWEKVNQSVHDCIQKFQQLGDSSRLGTSLIIQADLHYYRGEYGQALELCDRVYSLGRRSGSPQQQAWGLGSKAEIVLRQGYFGHADEVVGLIEEATRMLAENPDLTEATRNNGTLAVALLRLGEFQAAFDAAEEAGKLIAQSPTPTLFSVFEGYAGRVEVYVSLWEMFDELSKLPQGSKRVTFTRRDCQQKAKKALKSLRDYARIFPIGRPRARLWQGTYAFLRGNRNKALKSWQECLHLAEDLGMPHEAGRAHFNIGKYLTQNGEQGTPHLEQARLIFDQVGAGHDLKLVRQELGLLPG